MKKYLTCTQEFQTLTVNKLLYCPAILTTKFSDELTSSDYLISCNSRGFTVNNQVYCFGGHTLDSKLFRGEALATEKTPLYSTGYLELTNSNSSDLMLIEHSNNIIDITFFLLAFTLYLAFEGMKFGLKL